MELDLSKPERMRRVIRRIAPTAIINAAAYTAVDRAESEREQCFTINAIAPGVLAEEARRVGALLIHYSTDYVFDGRKSEPYVETDEPAPLNVYGESKLAGERAVTEVGGESFVLRTSWVYGAHGNNFMRTILRLAREREELQVVDDQIGAPTWSRFVASATAHVISLTMGIGNSAQPITATGIYHLTSRGSTSWYSFARAILAQDPRAKEQRCARLVPISSDAYPTAAIRPAKSVLCGSKFSAHFGLSLPSWESQLPLALA